MESSLFSSVCTSENHINKFVSLFFLALCVSFLLGFVAPLSFWLWYRRYTTQKIRFLRAVTLSKRDLSQQIDLVLTFIGIQALEKDRHVKLMMKHCSFGRPNETVKNFGATRNSTRDEYFASTLKSTVFKHTINYISSEPWNQDKMMELPFDVEPEKFTRVALKRLDDRGSSPSKS